MYWTEPNTAHIRCPSALAYAMALADLHTGTHYNRAYCRYECLAVICGDTVLLGYYSEYLPIDMQNRIDQMIWSEFVRANEPLSHGSNLVRRASREEKHDVLL